MIDAHFAVVAIAGLSTAGVLAKPFGLPEAVWAMLGAAALVAVGLLSPADALTGAAKGTDVYLFLCGMMALAEVARLEGLFDWLAAHAARRAAGSGPKLFASIYGVGILVTVLLSNDATAIVLTPAVAAAVRAAKVKDALPHLLVCAFIANAASFVLPISNPANLVIYGDRMPRLLPWLAQFALPSLLAILATYAVLRWRYRAGIAESVATDVPVPALTRGGRIAAAGLSVAAVLLVAASALGWPLGITTAISGAGTLLLVAACGEARIVATLRGISWDVVPLVAGLFVLVEALDKVGVIGLGSELLRSATQALPALAPATVGLVTAFGSNLVNNLPAGLIASSVLRAAESSDAVSAGALIGIDLGPNLSVTGSLATLLWLTALRRESIAIGGLAFVRIGLLVMPPALLLALGALLLQGYVW